VADSASRVPDHLSESAAITSNGQGSGSRALNRSPDGEPGRRVSWRGRQATDPLGRDHNVVKVTDPLPWRATIPIILEEDRVDPVTLPRANPVEINPAGFEIPIDPELEDSVRGPWGVQLDVGLDATPLARFRCGEKIAVVPGSKPSQVKCARSLYCVVANWPLESIPVAGSRARVSPGPSHR
jgi:hypothetical protein